MQEFNYKKVAKEIGWNFTKLNIQTEQDVNFNYYEEVAKNINENTVMLDIGCGSADKSSIYFKNAKKIIQIDIEEEMLKKAKANVIKNAEKDAYKFELGIGNGYEKLPYQNQTFDLVVSRHCGANMQEVFRVLKKGGKFISQDIDKYDCWALKQMFKRGQNYNRKKTIKQKTIDKCLSLNFQKVELLNIKQTEYYKTKEDLIYLLERTPILNEFDLTKDEAILNKYIEKYSTNKGIQLNRCLYAIKLVKKRRDY
ncbi:MAG: class I SAM-dependent methyltransferase [Clostridia bacterium]|nr:class I SAM-dependent methyltransferase [Clostridia bacterium]MBQ9793296.1 class I SAM-dependent methyltransferase [Clostridia bacterium]